MEGLLCTDAVRGFGIKAITPILMWKLAVWHVPFLFKVNPLVHKSVLATNRQLVRLPIEDFNGVSSVLFRLFWDFIALDGIFKFGWKILKLRIVRIVMALIILIYFIFLFARPII